ncbi:MAG TPA: nucleotidyltransferase [Chthonomonadaceae bacterium]|nr:nucleotidyltransferase [Chthonomonadaceae bacterium]
MTGLIPAEDWPPIQAALETIHQRGLRFALGGGLAFSGYSGRWRNTKDMDLYVLPSDREAAIEATAAAGFTDYYDQEPYDRSWIYRGIKAGVILDIIWTMPNHRMEVDPVWLTLGDSVTMHGLNLRLLSPEELILAKLFVLQRDRSDWPDILNILGACAARLDWERMLQRLDGDAFLLGGVMSVFRWLCPEKAQPLPAWIWGRLGLTGLHLASEPEDCRHRARLLDSRDWFGPDQGRKESCLSER